MKIRLKTILHTLARSKIMKIIHIINCMLVGLGLLEVSIFAFKIDYSGVGIISKIITKLVGVGCIYFAISRSIRMFLNRPELNPMEESQEIKDLRKLAIDDTKSAIHVLMTKRPNINLKKATRIVEGLKKYQQE